MNLERNIFVLQLRFNVPFLLHHVKNSVGLVCQAYDTMMKWVLTGSWITTERETLSQLIFILSKGLSATDRDESAQSTTKGEKEESKTKRKREGKIRQGTASIRLGDATAVIAQAASSSAGTVTTAATVTSTPFPDRGSNPALEAIKDAAEIATAQLINHLGNFPTPPGPSRISTLFRESEELEHLRKWIDQNGGGAASASPASRPVDGPASELRLNREANGLSGFGDDYTRKFIRYYLLDGRVVLGLIERPYSKDGPSITVVVRDAVGKFSWTSTLRYRDERSGANGGGAGLRSAASMGAMRSQSPDPMIPPSPTIDTPSGGGLFFSGGPGAGDASTTGTVSLPVPKGGSYRRTSAGGSSAGMSSPLEFGSNNSVYSERGGDGPGEGNKDGIERAGSAEQLQQSAGTLGAPAQQSSIHSANVAAAVPTPGMTVTFVGDTQHQAGFAVASSNLSSSPSSQPMALLPPNPSPSPYAGLDQVRSCNSEEIPDLSEIFARESEAATLYGKVEKSTSEQMSTEMAWIVKHVQEYVVFCVIFLVSRPLSHEF
jgi:hypothetical protein